MYQLSCSEVWGGIQDEDVDACSAAMTTSLYSDACDGGKGGDIYYVSVCHGDVLTRVALADVVGHGEKVSQVSQWLYNSLKERMNGGDGSDILADLNRLAYEHGFKAITTAAVVTFRADGAGAQFSYAGHHPVLVRPEGAAHWEPIQLVGVSNGMANLPLGIDLGVRFDQRVVKVRSGDRLFLYTDGVIETPGLDGGLFGERRLRTLLDEVGDKSLYDLKTTVLTTLRQYAGGELTHDDVTLLAMEVR